MVPYSRCPSDPCSTHPISVHRLIRFVADPSPFHYSLLPEHSVRRHSETTISLSFLSFRFTLDELMSSDVARELQLLFSDTVSLMQSNPTTLRKIKSHLEQFPSLASSQCVILSWFDSSDTFLFQTGCVVSHGNPVTTSDYLLYFAREGLNQLRERTGEIHCVVTIVAGLREIRFPPVEQIVRSMEKGDVFQAGKNE